MTGRAKRIYFLLKNKSKENETERAMILKTAEEILTLKQWLVFRMKINGERNKEIAKKCGVSEATISEHWVTGLEKVSESCKYMLPVLRFSEEKARAAVSCARSGTLYDLSAGGGGPISAGAAENTGAKTEAYITGLRGRRPKLPAMGTADEGSGGIGALLQGQFTGAAGAGASQNNLLFRRGGFWRPQGA